MSMVYNRIICGDCDPEFWFVDVRRKNFCFLCACASHVPAGGPCCLCAHAGVFPVPPRSSGMGAVFVVVWCLVNCGKKTHAAVICSSRVGMPLHRDCHTWWLPLSARLQVFLATCVWVRPVMPRAARVVELPLA